MIKRPTHRQMLNIDQQLNEATKSVQTAHGDTKTARPDQRGNRLSRAAKILRDDFLSMRPPQDVAVSGGAAPSNKLTTNRRGPS